MAGRPYHKEADHVWSGLGNGFSCISQRVLPPWDLIAEHVMHNGQEGVSHAALCTAAFFGEGMVLMPSETSLQIIWDEKPLSIWCRPAAKDSCDRYLSYILLKCCTRDTIMKMRQHVNTAHTSAGNVRPIPQFEMLFRLMEREVEYAAVANSRAVYDDLMSIVKVMIEVCRFQICPVKP